MNPKALSAPSGAKQQTNSLGIPAELAANERRYQVPGRRGDYLFSQIFRLIIISFSLFLIYCSLSLTIWSFVDFLLTLGVFKNSFDFWVCIVQFCKAARLISIKLVCSQSECDRTSQHPLRRGGATTRVWLGQKQH